jgi:hypothetical protein
MRYRGSKPVLRYEKEIRTFFLEKELETSSARGKIIFIICKSTLNLNWCGVFEAFKARHEFHPSVPINHTQRAHMFQMIPRINRKYLSEHFQVTDLRNDDTLSLR